jgi:putative addiction module component (TIGR02574 family)
MTKKSEQLLKDALKLDPVERAEFVEKLLSSFLLSPDPAIDNLWSKEAEERIDAYESGHIHTRSAQRVFDKIDNKENPRTE